MLQSQSAAGAFDAVLHVGDFAYNMNDDQGTPAVFDDSFELAGPLNVTHVCRPSGRLLYGND